MPPRCAARPSSALIVISRRIRSMSREWRRCSSSTGPRRLIVAQPAPEAATRLERRLAIAREVDVGHRVERMVDGDQIRRRQPLHERDQRIDDATLAQPLDVIVVEEDRDVVARCFALLLVAGPDRRERGVAPPHAAAPRKRTRSIGTRAPSLSTSKSGAERSVAGRPSASVTIASTCTSVVPPRKIGGCPPSLGEV